MENENLKVAETSSKARFSDAPFFAKAQEAVAFIGGAGGIGSWLAPLLARTGANVTIADFDLVEEVNFAGQLFDTKDIGELKIHAVAKIVETINIDSNLSPLLEKISSASEISEPFVFSAFDNMKARKELFEIWAKNPDRKLFVDARLLADQYEVYFVQKGQEDKYRETLFEDSEVEEVACTFKQTSHFAAMCAARMVHGFTNYLSKDALYKLPFKFSEEGNLFFNETDW